MTYSALYFLKQAQSLPDGSVRQRAQELRKSVAAARAARVAAANKALTPPPPAPIPAKPSKPVVHQLLDYAVEHPVRAGLTAAAGAYGAAQMHRIRQEIKKKGRKDKTAETDREEGSEKKPRLSDGRLQSRFSEEQREDLAEKAGLKLKEKEDGKTRGKIDPKEFKRGLKVEREHADVLKGNEESLARVAAAHLKERPDYYTRLKKVEGKEASVTKEALLGIGASIKSKGRHHLSVGFPYGLGYSHEFGDTSTPGLKPTVGIGLTGPHVGVIHRSEGAAAKEKLRRQRASAAREKE